MNDRRDGKGSLGSAVKSERVKNNNPQIFENGKSANFNDSIF